MKKILGDVTGHSGARGFGGGRPQSPDVWDLYPLKKIILSSVNEGRSNAVALRILRLPWHGHR